MAHVPLHDPAAGAHDWRPRLIVVGLLCVWVVLAGRLAHLQWYDRAELAQRANRQQSTSETIPARPGEILDRHGRLLATTITTQSLFVVPSHIENPWQFSFDLADRLDIDADRLFERIAENREKHFLWVSRRMSEEEADRVRAMKLPTETWGFREEYLRRYPQGALAAHVLGLRDIDGVGRGGIEQNLDSVLRGHDGQRLLVRDARGRVIEVRDAAETAPQHGQNVVLTIDAVLQLYTERELDRAFEEWAPKSASAIVMDPRTAEILALASRPTFDPNHPAGAAEAAWKNVAISAMYEPGSTFKPFVVAWAMELGMLRPDETFHCENGEYRMGRRILHDHHPYGHLSVTNILVKSSNIGMAKIGERIGNPELYEAAIHFGFGSRTGIELPGELPGMVHPLRKWNGYSTGSIPMGHELAVTPLQLITAHAALANGGTYQSPRLVLRQTHVPGILDLHPDAGRTSPAIVSQTVRPEVAQWIVQEPMTQVVSRGTGRKAQLSDYVVFGKTGTAQKLDPKTGEYSKTRHVSSFICGAPAHDPRVLVLVTVDEPTLGHSDYGGEVAAPVAGRILHKMLVHLRVPTKDSSPRRPLDHATNRQE